MKKIFVTGASGFIGSHLVEKLVLSGYKVKALITYNRDNSSGWLDTLEKRIKNKIELVIGNINDSFLIEKETNNCDVVFHLAALISIPYSYVSPLNYIDTNVMGTLNVLQAVRKNKIKHFIHTSTSEVYGSARSKLIDEEHFINAQSPYAASKVAADQLVSSFWNTYRIPATIIRPFNTFGPRQSLRAVLPNIICQINRSKGLKNLNLKLGNLHSKRDFTYIDDTINGFFKCIGNRSIIHQTINLGTGKSFSIKECVNLLENIANKKIKIISEKKRFRPKHSEVNTLTSNNKKAKKF